MGNGRVNLPAGVMAAWQWLQASDPGLSRLRMAASAAVAMASALAVEWLFAHFMQADYAQTLVVMILGALVAMLGAMALTATVADVRTKVTTAACFPVAIGAGLLLGVAVGGHVDWMLSVFVVVMFVAVYVRRFGVAFFFHGFMFWLGYFFASFLGAELAMMPLFMAAVVLGSAWVLLLALTVLRINCARTLQRTINAFDARARRVNRACARLLQSPGAQRSRTRRRLQRRVYGQERRLAETALMVDAWAAEPTALPAGQSAALLRRRLIGAQQALDALVATTQELVQADEALRQAVARIAWCLARRDDAGAAHQARALERRTGASRGDTATAAQRSAHRFARATLVFVSLARAARQLRAGSAEADTEHEFAPAAPLIMGNLPGSPAVARGLSARGARWNPLARLDLTSRQAVQVALAGGLAILAGRALSPTRYYWAVIAAFVMFSGTATRSETFLKGLSRVVGTALGLTVAVVLAEYTAGHPLAIVTMIVLSMFCGFYLLRINYAYMIFFVTIMVAQLYTVLHEFTPGLLVLRLEETAIGAGLGFAIAMLCMPLSTRDTARSARRQVLLALSALLEAAAAALEACDESTQAPATATASGSRMHDLHAHSRTLDDCIRRFALVTQPLTQLLLGGGRHRLARRRLGRYVAMATSARALIVSLDELSAAERDANLAAATRALSRAAGQLAERRPGRRESVIAQPLAEAQAGLVGCEPHTGAGERLLEALRHMHFLLSTLSVVA